MCLVRRVHGSDIYVVFHKLWSSTKYSTVIFLLLRSHMCSLVGYKASYGFRNPLVILPFCVIGPVPNPNKGSSPIQHWSTVLYFV